MCLHCACGDTMQDECCSHCATETVEIQACQMRVGDVLVRERFRSTHGTVRRLAQPNPGDPSVGFYLNAEEAPRWFDPEEIVQVERRITPPTKSEVPPCP